MDPLVSPDWLAARLDEPQLRLVDCRFELGDTTAGWRQYLAGHIPGAAFLDLDADLSEPPAASTPPAPRGAVGGRHPLPDAARFAAAVRRAGIGDGTTVVAYDAAMTGGAARLWWLLRHWGFDSVGVLDGGLAGWDGALHSGEETIPPGDFMPAEARRDDLVNAEQIHAAIDSQRLVVLDARAPERFRGEHEPIDPVAGHIPGARNLPLNEATQLPAELVTDKRQLVASCGSGVAACVLLLRLAAAGRDDAQLYPGSWSDWVARGLPVEHGSTERAG